MFDKLSAAEERYEDLAAKLCDPGLVSDNALYRDTMREYKMIRTIRRAGIPIWYTEGFNPHPFMTFAMPLSLGTSGMCRGE